jgi:hypothetical protein
MANINFYKTVLEKVFREEAEKYQVDLPKASRRLYIGDDKTHFVLIEIGWAEKRYLHRILFTVEIINDKIWIHEDNTDIDLVGKLLDSGIPKSDIVLGFVPVYARDIEGFAVG